MSRPVELREPTHMLTITVPLDMDANPAAETWDIGDAVAEALKAIIAMIRLGTLGLLCGDLTVVVTPSSVESESE